MQRMALFSLAFLLSFSVKAQEDLRARAQAAWAERGNPQKAMLAFELYKKLAAQNPDDMEARIMTAKAAYWVTELDDRFSRMDKDDKVKIMEQGIAAAREVLEKDEDNLAGNYWLMWDMAAKTYYKGLFSGFALRDSVVCTIMVSKTDINYEHGGVWRYWGRVIHEIPGLLGRFFHFTTDDSVWLYKRAIEIDPLYLRNHFWLAESYQKIDQDELAKKEYEFCADFDLERAPEIKPENRYYQEWCKERLDDF